MRPTKARLSTSFPGLPEEWDDVSRSMVADIRRPPPLSWRNSFTRGHTPQGRLPLLPSATRECDVRLCGSAGKKDRTFRAVPAS
ncbi:hypothetical protein HDA41_002733 [Streptomyces caelestis]|uniref:Uncharacterized protein n=1 Tax=Streptomyces caelestis TaxID=36816 RepID=A0A7W9H3R1_9ACTN|nr:hypothetical protein [Streptomyces caelestis]